MIRGGSTRIGMGMTTLVRAVSKRACIRKHKPGILKNTNKFALNLGNNAIIYVFKCTNTDV